MKTENCGRNFSLYFETKLGHFRINFSFFFKASLCAKSLLWILVLIHIEIRTYYPNKNCALEETEGNSEMVYARCLCSALHAPRFKAGTHKGACSRSTLLQHTPGAELPRLHQRFLAKKYVAQQNFCSRVLLPHIKLV